MTSTVGSRSDETRGRSSGFDYLRLTLAVSIVGLHTLLTGQGVAADVDLAVGPWRPFLRLILPMFFALSGYLVAGSLERCKTLGMFLGLRAIRIYPALMVEVVLSAFILGPLVTTLPLRDYFLDPLFRQYLLNVLGDVHFTLPGVFASNPLPAVMNGQLWTIPFELYCYITLAVLTLFGIKIRRWIGPAGVIAITLAYLAVTLYRHNGEFVFVTGAINGALLVVTFLAGVAIYQYRYELPWGSQFGAPALIGAAALLAYIPGGDFFAGPLAAYATVWIGLMNPSRRLLRGTDYSYGIYLYGFAIQQTVVYMLPAAHLWYVNALVSMPIVVLVAAFSWHVVEKPANRLRPLLSRGEAWVISWRLNTTASAASLAEFWESPFFSKALITIGIVFPPLVVLCIPAVITGQLGFNRAAVPMYPIWRMMLGALIVMSVAGMARFFSH